MTHNPQTCKGCQANKPITVGGWNPSTSPQQRTTTTEADERKAWEALRRIGGVA